MAGPFQTSSEFGDSVRAPRIAPPAGLGAAIARAIGTGLEWLAVIIAMTALGSVMAGHVRVLRERQAAGLIA